MLLHDRGRLRLRKSSPSTCLTSKLWNIARHYFINRVAHNITSESDHMRTKADMDPPLDLSSKNRRKQRPPSKFNIDSLLPSLSSSSVSKFFIHMFLIL